MVEFLLGHVVFDEHRGPTLKAWLHHNYPIPEVILQGITTTLFTMAIGVGQPTGEAQTAIIPINITSLQGRALIYSYSVHDVKARGKRRMEAFMLFISKSYQDKLLRDPLYLIKTISEGVNLINEGYSSEEVILRVFDNIKKILLAELDYEVQQILNQNCTEKDAVIISDGTIKGLNNVMITPNLINQSNDVLKAVKGFILLIDQLERMESEHFSKDSTTGNEMMSSTNITPAYWVTEVYGRTNDAKYFYMLGFLDRIAILFTPNRLQIGQMTKSFREILWDLKLKTKEKTLDITPWVIKPSQVEKMTKKSQYLDDCETLLKNLNIVIDEYSIIRRKNEEVSLLRKSSLKESHLHLQLTHLLIRINNLLTEIMDQELIITQLLCSIQVEDQHRNIFSILWDTHPSTKGYLYLTATSQRDIGLLNILSQRIQSLKNEKTH